MGVFPQDSQPEEAVKKIQKEDRKPGAFLPVLLSVVLPLLFASNSCGDDHHDSQPRVGIVYDTVGKEDKSFNQSAYEGIKRAKAELGVVVSEETTDGMDREELIRSLASDNDLVIAVGYSFDGPIKKVAAENPDTNFAGVDIQQGENSPENFASLLFDEAEGSFLVGAAAALTTRTDKIGFIGGVCSTPDKIIERFEAGFITGAKTVNQDIAVETEYLSHGNDHAGFRNSTKAEMVALRMFDGGADVIFHAAGASGAGLFRAAEKRMLWAIGVDSDQYKTVGESERERLLTSMIKKVDVAVYNIIQAQKNGEFSGGEVTHNLSNGGVDYSTSGGFVDNIKDRLENYKTSIIDGEIKVPADPGKSCATPQIY